MTSLRQRMLEDMSIRNLAENTQLIPATGLVVCATLQTLARAAWA